MLMPDEFERQRKQEGLDAAIRIARRDAKDIQKEPKIFFGRLLGLAEGRNTFYDINKLSNDRDLGLSTSEIEKIINDSYKERGLSNKFDALTLPKKYTKEIMQTKRDNKKDGGKLVGGQKELDKNNDGDITGEDFAMLREEREKKLFGGIFKDVIQTIRTNPQVRQKLGMPELETDEYGQLKPLPPARISAQVGGELQNPEKADLDNDGKLSSYEEARGKAIEKNMREEMFLGGILRLGISGAKSLIKNIRKKTNKKEDRNKVDEMELEIEQLEKNYNDTFLPEDSYPLGGAPTDATLKMTREKILKDMDKITSNIEKLSSRVSKQVGGMMMDDQMNSMMQREELPALDNQMADMMSEEKTEEQKAIEEAQAPDEQMEENYVDFLIDEALSDDEEEMLMKELQANPQLSMLFDKVMEVAMEFSGSGPVEGPGTEVSDSIPARLSDGEFVFTAKSVDVLGADNLMSLMKQAEAQADQRQMAQEGGLMEEEETAMPVQQEPVRQDIRVTKETVGPQASMQEEDDLIGDELKKQMLSGRPHVRS